jgi:Bifunctional DNA primase/polymerase, N-terminal
VTGAERDALRAAMQLPYPSFPCLADKRPACPSGFKAATLPEAGLATLWARHPGELVGVPTGPRSGVAVLDVDGRNGGREWWLASKGRLPSTRMHRTRNGGLHVLFKHRPGLRNSAGKIAPGIDVRAEGGYVIWWPAHGLAVQDHPCADWPDWLTPPEPAPAPVAPRPRDSGPATLAAIEGIVRTVATAPTGQRNAITFWAACRMVENAREGKISAGLARELLIEAAGRAGLPAAEAGRTIDSAMRSICCAG